MFVTGQKKEHSTELLLLYIHSIWMVLSLLGRLDILQKENW